MRKFRFSKYIVLFLAIALLPASGLSAWYFNHINHTHQLDVQLGVDDIEENYSFSDTRIEEETYTIIFYPSILYMFMDNPDQFGYILASANPNGEAVFDDSNVTTGDEGYKNVVKNNNFFLDDNYGLVDNTTNHQNVYGMNQDNGLYNTAVTKIIITIQHQMKNYIILAILTNSLYMHLILMVDIQETCIYMIDLDIGKIETMIAEDIYQLE